MTKKLAICKILEEYNGIPEVFTAMDSNTTRYICILVDYRREDERPEQFVYIATPISDKKYQDYINCNIDLRVILDNPEIKEYYILFDRDFGTSILATLMNSSLEDIANEFFLPNSPHYYIQDKFVAYSNVMNNFKMFASYTEASEWLKHYQIKDSNGKIPKTTSFIAKITHKYFDNIGLEQTGESLYLQLLRIKKYLT